MKLVDSGLARELARVNLPLSMYTEWYWQIDLHNLFRFLSLRMDAHAQREIRDYAGVIFDITRNGSPARLRQLRAPYTARRTAVIRRRCHCQAPLERDDDGVSDQDRERLLGRLKP